MKKPLRSLLELTKKRLRTDFTADRFDPPERLGTPAKHEPAQIQKKEFSTPSPEENPFRFTPNDFRGYKLKLMSAPLFDIEFNRDTVYLQCDNNKLFCTVCDSNRTITKSVIDLADLRNSDIKIETPLQSAEIEPILPVILIIHTIDSIQQEKEKLERKTEIKRSDKYLHAYIELIRESLYQESSAMAQIKIYEHLFSSDMKNEFEILENEFHGLLEFTLDKNAAMHIKNLIADKKSNYNQIDINTTGGNVLSSKLKSIINRIDAFEEEMLNQPISNQHKPEKETPHQLPSWTQRDAPTKESQNTDQDESDETFTCK